jgi:[ribosomal protein S18]-alanine N-acetyltransferase
MASESEATIRLGGPQDAEAIHSILVESPQASLWSVSSIEDLFRQPGITALMAEATGEDVGFIIGRWVANEAEILNLAVRAAERRKGLAGRLFQSLIAKLKEPGTTRLYLEVRDSNATAIHFYQKLGFTQIGRRDGYYRNPPGNALVLEMKLESTD